MRKIQAYLSNARGTKVIYQWLHVHHSKYVGGSDATFTVVWQKTGVLSNNLACYRHRHEHSENYIEPISCKQIPSMHI